MGDLKPNMTKGRGISKHLQHRESACPHAGGTGQRQIPTPRRQPLGGLPVVPHQFEDRFQAGDHIAGFQKLLPLLDEDRLQRRHGIGQQGGVFELRTVWSSSTAGSSSAAHRCVSRNSRQSVANARSMARLDFSRPTKIGATICGNITRSRIGMIGIATRGETTEEAAAGSVAPDEAGRGSLD